MRSSEIVRVVAHIHPPYVYPCFEQYSSKANTKCRQPGVEIVLIYNQLISLGFQPQLIKADNYSHTKFLLENNMADISASSSTIHDAGNLSFTLPLDQGKLVFMVGRHESAIGPSLLFYQCDWLLWLTVAVSLIVCYLMKKFHNYATKAVRSVVNPTDFSSKFPLVAWGLCFVIFSSLYSNNLALTLVHRPIDVPFDNLEEMSKKLDIGQCQFVLSKFDAAYYNSVEQLIIDGMPRYYANRIVTAVDQAVVLPDNTKEELLAKITEKECYIGVAFETDGTIWQSINDRIAIIKLEEMHPLTYVFYVNPIFKSKNEKRLAYLNSGSISTLYKTYLEKILEENRHDRGVETNIDRKTFQKHESLKIYQLYDTFYVLFSGMIIGGMTFLFTVIKKQVQNLNFSNNF